MPIAKDNLSTNAMGGTELMKYGLVERMPEGLLDDFQIFVSRVQEELDPNKIKLYWHQDLPWDPAATHLAEEGWKRFDHFVFNSNWQMEMFNRYLGVPYERSTVLENAIVPIPIHRDRNEGIATTPMVKKPSSKDGIVRVIYHTTPHRGLELLVPIFEKICEDYENVQLDVYSSFSIYGWNERDKPYEQLFEKCKNHPKINYHGAVSNEEVRKALQQADIFAYPCVWVESSCIALMEAMSAGCICVHPNYGALYDTSGGITRIYNWRENPNDHAYAHYVVLKNAIDSVLDNRHTGEINFIKQYADLRFNWDNRAVQWKALLEGLRDAKKSLASEQTS